jgi:hypothetical protein
MAINAQVAVEKLMAWKPNSIQASQHALGQKQSGLLIVRIVACKTKLTQMLANLALNFGTNAWHASMNSRFAQEPNCSRKSPMQAPQPECAWSSQRDGYTPIRLPAIVCCLAVHAPSL